MVYPPALPDPARSFPLRRGDRRRDQDALRTERRLRALFRLAREDRAEDGALSAGRRPLMWVRSAFWIGRPRPGEEEAFRAAIDGELVPGLKALPFVDGARSLWPQRLEDNPPGIHCQVIVEFVSQE